MKRVSIAIPTVNAPILEQCLESVFENTGPGYELIIVCDTPNEERRKLLKRIGDRPDTHIIINPSRVGAPRAFNQCLEAATREYIMLMNDDNVVKTKDWIVPLVEALEAHPEFGIVCPREIQPKRDEENFFAAIGGGTLISRKLIDKVGKFDESEDFTYQCVDGDYYMRVKEAGYQIRGMNESAVYHLVGQTIKPDLNQQPELIMEKLRTPLEKLVKKYGAAILVDQHRHRPYKPTPSYEGMLLELGGGNNPEFHPNIDIKPGPGVDIVASLEEPLPIRDSCVDAVVCRYALEHISWRKVKQLISEVARILNDNGNAIFITANLKEQARVIATSDAWEGDYESRLIFGDQGYPENTHKCGFSPEYITRLFREVGLRTAVEPHPNCPTDMIIKATKMPLERLGWVAKKIKELAPSKLLDIGCRDAQATINLPNAILVDNMPYEELVSECAKMGVPAPPRERFVHAWAEDLPFDNNECDLIILTELLEHVEDPVQVLKEAARVAKKAIITVPNEYDWDISLKPFTNSSHVRCYTKDMLKRHLKQAGIKDYKLDSLDYEGWCFYTVVANLPDVKNIKKINIVEDKAKVQPAEPMPVAPVTAHAIVKETNLEPFTKTLNVAILSTPFFTVPPKGYGGLEVVVADIAKGLADLGHKVTIFAPEGSHIDGCETFAFGPTVDTVGVDWLQLENDRMMVSKERIFSDSFDIVHGNNWFGFEYALKAERPQLKVCHTHHGGLNVEWWARSKPPWALNLISISKWMQQVYASQGFNARPIYNGIDMGKYIFKQEKGDRLIFVGRASTFKQPHVAIEVAKKLGLGLDLVCGTFVDSQAYLEQVKGMCDGKQIRWVENPPQDEKVVLIQDAKCLLFPSKMGEPFGLVAAEAMACGTPVVALNDGAIAEVIGEVGFVCQTADEMAEAVKKVDSISPKACRDRVQENFSREVAAKEYAKAYHDIISGREW